MLSITFILALGAALGKDFAGTSPLPGERPCLADGGPAAPTLVTVERSAFLMGTRLELAVEGESRQAAVAGSEAALEALEAAESRLSTWSEDSELSRFNRSPVGARFASSPELWRELNAAAACSELTGGAFDPSVGPLVAAWGLRSGGRQPSAGVLATALAAVGLDGLELRGEGALARTRADLAIEEGGFGKGAGLDRAIERIAGTPGATSALLDFGGQVAVWRAPRRRVADPMSKVGRDPAIEPFSIAIADPARRFDPVIALAIDHGSISTTGSSERGITVDGRHLSHVLDPRTGLPATDIGSVTVWAPNALLADCLSTGLYVLGTEAIERWAAAHPEIGVLVLATDAVRGSRLALASAALDGRITALAPDLEVRLWGSNDPNEALSPARRENTNCESGGPRPIATRRTVRRSLQHGTGHPWVADAAGASIHAASGWFGTWEKWEKR